MVVLFCIIVLPYFTTEHDIFYCFGHDGHKLLKAVHLLTWVRYLGPHLTTKSIVNLFEIGAFVEKLKLDYYSFNLPICEHIEC